MYATSLNLCPVSSFQSEPEFGFDDDRYEEIMSTFVCSEIAASNAVIDGLSDEDLDIQFYRKG